MKEPNVSAKLLASIFRVEKQSTQEISRSRKQGKDVSYMVHSLNL
jgi:hypothetical protein